MPPLSFNTPDWLTGLVTAEKLRVYLAEVSWSDYKRGTPTGWIGQADTEDPLHVAVNMRRWVRRVPFIGVRVAQHEADHLTCADFRTNDDHHDAPAYLEKTGEAPHICGRNSRGFFSMFSGKHLKTPASLAVTLFREGFVDLEYEPGSLLSDAALR